MHRPLQRAESVPELLRLQHHDDPYDFASLFEEGGWRARRRSKKKLELLKRIDDRVRAMLHEDERAVFVTRGCIVSPLEWFLLGMSAYYLNRRAIVITDRRLLLVQIDSRLRPRDLHAQIRFPALIDLRRSGLGNVSVRLRGGGAVVLTHVPRRDRRAIREMAEGWIVPDPGRMDPVALEHLCPHCFHVVAGRPPSCPTCRGRLKSAKKAGLLSLLFPGIGDFYIGHRKLALMEMSVAGLIWVGVLFPGAEVSVAVPELIAIVLFVIVFMHGIDALATWYLAGRGLHPERE